MSEDTIRIAFDCRRARTFQSRLNDIVVIGAGCIGQSLVASLLKSNIANRVFLICKTEHISKIQKIGITLMGAFEENFMQSERFIVSNKINSDLLLKYKIHQRLTVFLSTKANDAVSSMDLFHNTLSTLSLVVICLQNGLGVEHDVERVFF